MAKRRGSVVGAVVLSALATTPLAGPSLAAAETPTDATRVTGPCRGGPGNASLSVAPNGDGSYRMEMVGRRMVEDSAWRVEVVMEDDDGDHVTVLRPVAEQGAWRVSADTAVSARSWVSFYAVAARTDHDGGDTLCLLATEPGRPAFGATVCGRGFNLLNTWRRPDGSTVLHYRLYGARNMGWRLTMRVDDGPDDVRSVSFDDSADERGRVATRVTMTGLDDPRYAVRAVSERGAVCWMRLDPSDSSSDGSGNGPLTPRELMRRARP